MRQRFWELGGSRMGKAMGVADEKEGGGDEEEGEGDGKEEVRGERRWPSFFFFFGCKIYFFFFEFQVVCPSETSFFFFHHHFLLSGSTRKYEVLPSQRRSGQDVVTGVLPSSPRYEVRLAQFAVFGAFVAKGVFF